jgi:hypothetical protein
MFRLTPLVLTGLMLLGLAYTAQAKTVDIQGLLARGSFHGTFVYDETAPPLAINVRHLGPNVTYALSSYQFTVTTNCGPECTPGYGLGPETGPWPGVGPPETLTFSHLATGQSYEYCEGKCIFASPLTTTLILTQPNFRFQVSYEPNEVALQPNASGFNWNYDGRSGSWMGVTQAERTITNSVPTNSVPLPGMLWPTVVGLAGLILFTTRRVTS